MATYILGRSDYRRKDQILMLHYQKDLNVEASYDVVVAGCGASGVCADVLGTKSEAFTVGL